MCVSGKLVNLTEGMTSINISQIKVIKQYARVSKVFIPEKDPPIFEGRTELDTHADTFVAGRNCLLMNYTERVCDVMPYSDEYEAR